MKFTSNLTQFSDSLQSGKHYEPIGAYHIGEPGYSQPFPHWHRHYEVLLIVSGHYRIENNGRIAADTSPRAIVHLPYSLHDCHAFADRMYERYMVTFTQQLLHTFAPEPLELDVLKGASFIDTTPSPEEMESLIALAELLKNNREDLTLCGLLSAALLRKILLICESDRGVIVRGKFSYIQEALGYAAMQISHSLTAEEMAAHFHVSTSKFHRDFRATVGKTYKQHLTDLRQTFARELLTSGASIISTAIDTGYSSEAHFIKAFREYWGTTPGEFIKKQQEQR